MNHVNGTEAVSSCQHAVERSWCAAPLNVTQNHRACLESSAALELLRQSISNSSQPRVSELVFFSAQRHRPPGLLIEFRAFRNHHDAEVTSARVSHTDFRGDLFNVERLFGNQYYIGATGNSAIDCDPAGVASHNLDNHHAVVRF